MNLFNRKNFLHLCYGVNEIFVATDLSADSQVRRLDFFDFIESVNLPAGRQVSGNLFFIF